MTQISLEIVNFEREMKRIEEEIVAVGNLEIAALVEYGTQQLRVVTPVRTGNARRGWQRDIQRSFNNSFIGATIYNRVGYIDKLNQGTSQQAPTYFIEQTLSKIGLITPV